MQLSGGFDGFFRSVDVGPNKDAGKMSIAMELAQEKEWLILHDRITETLNRFGRKDAFGKGDYWLLDDNWGRHQHEVEVQNLNLLKPHIIKSLQALLAEYSDWRITVSVAVPGTENDWPGMGLIVYDGEIIDELQREFLPQEFQSIKYKGSKRFMERG